MMRKRATDQDYTEQQASLLPAGFAWTREPDSILMRFLKGLAVIWARVHNRALRLIEEADPSTAIELLADWERNAGLPDKCSATLKDTVQDRRAALIAKLTAKEAPTLGRFQKMISDLGYNASITEHRPFICGVSRCGASGDILNGDHNVRFVWTVTVHEPRVVRFRCGTSFASALPERLCKIDYAEELECRITNASPAYTLPVFDYSEMEG